MWSWDITKLRGPSKGVYYDLYVIMDIFSRYVVGWMVAPTETAELAKAFIADAIKTQAITAEVLTIHADRGAIAARALHPHRTQPAIASPDPPDGQV